MPDKNCYCFDSNVVIGMFSTDESYPKDIFVSIWNKFESLVGEGRMISSKEIYDEIKDDEKLKPWLKDNVDAFKDVTAGQVEIVKDIGAKYPALFTQNKNAGDRFLIAMAKEIGGIVFTSEKQVPASSPIRPRIPALCKEYGVKCVNIVEFCREEGLSF